MKNPAHFIWDLQKTSSGKFTRSRRNTSVNDVCSFCTPPPPRAILNTAHRVFISLVFIVGHFASNVVNRLQSGRQAERVVFSRIETWFWTPLAVVCRPFAEYLTAVLRICRVECNFPKIVLRITRVVWHVETYNGRTPLPRLLRRTVGQLFGINFKVKYYRWLRRFICFYQHVDRIYRRPTVFP